MSVLSGLGCLCTAGTVLAWRLDSGLWFAKRVSCEQAGPLKACCTASTWGPKPVQAQGNQLDAISWRQRGLAEESGREVSRQPWRGHRLWSTNTPIVSREIQLRSAENIFRPGSEPGSVGV